MNAGQWFGQKYADAEIPHAMTFVPRAPEQPKPPEVQPDPKPGRKVEKRTFISRQVMDYAVRAGRKVSPHEVAAALSLSKITVAMTMLRLTRRGKLARSGDHRHYRYKAVQ